MLSVCFVEKRLVFGSQATRNVVVLCLCSKEGKSDQQTRYTVARLRAGQQENDNGKRMKHTQHRGDVEYLCKDSRFHRPARGATSNNATTSRTMVNGSHHRKASPHPSWRGALVLLLFIVVLILPLRQQS